MQLFELGSLVATPEALTALGQIGVNPLELIKRHLSGDWGQLDAEDRQANDHAVKHGYRVFSAYVLSEEIKVWIITEHDRSSTCILLPEQY